MWRRIQRDNFRQLGPLLEFLKLDSEGFLFDSSFPLNVPRRLAEKMEKGNPLDPLLLQFLPTKHEEVLTNFSKDPLDEKTFRKGKKLIKKYEGRALLVTTSACAMNCRFCFRRHFPYEKEVLDFEEELKSIGEDSSLSEIILSGGDPLSLSDRVLGNLLERLSKMEHVKRIRFHTRFPIGIPERIDHSLITILENIPKQLFFVVHVNHPREIDADVAASLKKIQKLGIPVLNQFVLLKRVNDDLETLIELCETVADSGILPYYIHQLDQVEGASHFEVDAEWGKFLMQELTNRLSGYAVPKYVEEIPHQKSKMLINLQTTTLPHAQCQ